MAVDIVSSLNSMLSTRMLLCMIRLLSTEYVTSFHILGRGHKHNVIRLEGGWFFQKQDKKSWVRWVGGGVGVGVGVGGGGVWRQV